MRLNPDCIRDLLLTIEEKCDFENQWTYDKNMPLEDRLEKYTRDELSYHLLQCKRSNLIVAGKFYGQGGNLIVYDLSPEGHSFLANVRKDSIWDKTKSIAKEKICSISLAVLTQIAEKLVLSMINL